MYKSSSFRTFIFKYVHPLILLVGGAIAIFFMRNESMEVNSSFVNVFTVAYAWTSIFLLQAILRLKWIEANENGVLIKSGKTTNLVKYENIEYLAKFDIGSPWFMTMKYTEEGTNLSKKIAYIPSQKNQIFFKDDRLTDFIKAQMKTKIPHYDDSIHPGALRNLAILALLATPVLLLMLYFMRFSI